MMLSVVSCSRGDEQLDIDGEASEDVDSALSVGFESFSFELPCLDRFMTLVEEYGEQDVEIEFYMRGRSDSEDYSLVANMSLVGESIEVRATDGVALETLPHQQYLLNYMIKSGATRSSEEDAYPEGAVVIGALLSAEDPDNIYFVSTLSVDTSVNGDGTESSPYIIETVENFTEAIVEKVDGGSTLSGVYFLQSAELNFSGQSVGNIGKSNSTSFCGHYDGGMLVISQLSVSSTSDYAGLFYNLGSGGVISNLIIEKSTVLGTNHVGFIASQFSGGEILHLFVESGCTVTATGDMAGGFVGSGYGSIASSVFSGNVTGVSECGGFVGAIKESTGELVFYNCVYKGEVTVSDRYAGGLLGYGEDIHKITIDGAYISGTVCGKGNSSGRIGGLIGAVDNFGIVEIDDAKIGYLCSVSDDYLIGDPYESILILNYSGDSDSSTDYSDIGGLIGRVDNDEITAGAYVTVNGGSKSSSNSDTPIRGYSNIGGAFGSINNTILTGSFTNYADIDSKYSDESSCVGGVIGNMYNSKPVDCEFVNYGDVGAVSQSVAGVVGYYYPYLQNLTSTADGSTWSTNKMELTNYGNLNTSGDYVGGCIGYVSGNNTAEKHLYLKSYGAIKGSGYATGGLIGESHMLPYMVEATGAHECGGKSNYSVYIEGDEAVGGFIGVLNLYLSGDNTTFDYNIYGTLDVETITSDGAGVGGFIGSLYVQPYSAATSRYCNVGINIMETNSLVTISGTSYVGGVIGNFKVSLIGSEKYDYDYNVNINTADALSSSSVVQGSGTGVGGIMGSVHIYEDSNVTLNFNNCYNKAPVTSSDMGVGGILGKIYKTTSDDNDYDHDGESEFYVKFENCCNWGTITSSASYSRAGGIVGYVDEGERAYLTACYNGGDIVGSSYRGGLVGRTEIHTYLESCFNMGTVAAGGTDVAGLAGSIECSGTIEKINMHHCYNIGTTGFGTMGGEDLGSSDCNNSHNYYLDSASSGKDLDVGSSDNSTKLTASQMADGVTMSLDDTYFVYPSASYQSEGYLPYIKGIDYYKSKPKVSL